MILLAASCKKNEGVKCPIKVHVANFSIEQTNFPSRNTPVGTYTNVKVLTLAFYAADGTELYNHSQLRDDATTYTTFGEFECSLPMGTHTMVVIGYGGTNPFDLTGPTSAVCTDIRLQDTFVNTQSITINSNEGTNVSASLYRPVSVMVVKSSDQRVSNATKIRMTLTAGGRDFNPSTGFALNNTGFNNTIPFSTAVGATTSSGSYIFLATDEQTMNVTIETLDDNNNVLFSETVNDVPFKRNRQTIMTGRMFTEDVTGASFTIQNDWLGDYNMGF